MKLLLTLLFFGILGSSGWAQKLREKLSMGLHQEAPKTSNTNLVEDTSSSSTEKVPEHSTARQRKGEAATLGGPLIAGKGQCLVNGMIMYNGAAWSPQRCTICVCDQGKKVCEPLDCEEDIACPAGKLQIPPGECCPICVKTEKTQVPLESAATLNQAKVTAQKHKEVKKDTKQMKVKGDTTRITSRPALELNTTRNNNTTAIKPPKPKRTTAINRQVDGAQWKSPAKKEINNKKQETNVQKKEVKLHKTKKEENGEKNSHVEGLKTPQKKRPTEEKTRNKAIKKAASPIPSTKKPKTPHKETNNKQEDIKLLPPTPTMPGVPSFIRPTLPHIPSLPSGCLLSESAIACVNTKMTYLPLMTDPGLKILYLAENEISKLPARAFAGLPNLEWLDLSKNRLDDSGLSDDVFKNLTKLKRLNLDGNHLTFLPQLPTSLQELKVNDNNILELNRHSFHGLGHLLTLEMEGNGFHDGNVSPLTFKPLKKLIYLRLNRNHFRAVPSGLPPTIQELHLENNRIEVVSEGILNKTLNLSIIVLSNNRLQEDRIAPRAWIHLMNVESLDLSHNRLVHVPSFLPRGVKQLILHHNQIELIPGYVFAHMKPGLEFLHLSHNNLRDDGVHAVSFFGLYKSLNELLLDNNYFQSIPRGILNLKSLQVLRLSHNKIRYVPLNSICDTRISEDSNLVSVHLENNHINRHLIPPTALSCIKTYHSVILRPQHDEYEEY